MEQENTTNATLVRLAENRVVVGLVIGAVLALVGGYGAWYFTNIWIASAVFIGVFGGISLQGMQRIPAKPPHKGQLTVLGQRVPGKFMKEGWHFFPAYPHLYGIIPVKVERITFTVTVEGARTPDRAESKVPVLLTMRPMDELLTEYIDSGEEDGVKEQISGKVQELVREWAMGLEEGPADWIELNQSQLEGVSTLVKKIASDSITEIPDYAQEVPTWIWLRFYDQPRPKRVLRNEIPWAKPLDEDGHPDAEHGWKRVRDVLHEIEEKHGPETIAELEASVRARRQEIRDLRTGNGKIVLQDLGCCLERLNLGDINVLGKVGEQAEAQAKEREEQEAEKLELAHVRKRIEELMAEPFNYSPEQALEIIQTERGKVVKTIDEKKLSIAAESRDVVERVLTAFARSKR